MLFIRLPINAVALRGLWAVNNAVLHHRTKKIMAANRLAELINATTQEDHIASSSPLCGLTFAIASRLDEKSETGH